MSSYITLMGAETVGQAGRDMQSAADGMLTAVSKLEEVLNGLERINEGHLNRLEHILAEDRQKRGIN